MVLHQPFLEGIVICNVRGENQSTHRKPPVARVRANSERDLQSCMSALLGHKPGPYMLVGGICSHHCAIFASMLSKAWPSPHGQLCLLLVFYFQMWVGGTSEYTIFTVHTIRRLCSENKTIADSSRVLTFKKRFPNQHIMSVTTLDKNVLY